MTFHGEGGKTGWLVALTAVFVTVCIIFGAVYSVRQARFIDKLRFYGGVESVIIESSEILHPYPDWEQSDLSGLGGDGSGRAGGAA